MECVIIQQLPEMLHFGCNVISGIFTSKKSQEIAKVLGLKSLYEAHYSEWANQNNVIMPENILDENSTARVMAMQLT